MNNASQTLTAERIQAPPAQNQTPALLFDISRFNLNHIAHGVDEIERINPHRGHLRLLDGIIHVSEKRDQIIALKNVRHDEFWVKGQIPGQVLYPHVLMIESAAQVASYVTILRKPEVRFMGFMGVDNVRFYAQPTPGERMIIISREVEFRSRRITYNAQAIINNRIAMEATIMGVSM